jgi:hypothetical protein
MWLLGREKYYTRFHHDPGDGWRTVKAKGYEDQEEQMRWVDECLRGHFSNLYLGHNNMTLWYFEKRLDAILFALRWT